jgi:hypothetical protein
MEPSLSPYYTVNKRTEIRTQLWRSYQKATEDVDDGWVNIIWNYDRAAALGNPNPVLEE